VARRQRLGRNRPGTGIDRHVDHGSNGENALRDTSGIEGTEKIARGVICYSRNSVQPKKPNPFDSPSGRTKTARSAWRLFERCDFLQ
jgi:hypothetical protein